METAISSSIQHKPQLRLTRFTLKETEKHIFRIDGSGLLDIHHRNGFGKQNAIAGLRLPRRGMAETSDPWRDVFKFYYCLRQFRVLWKFKTGGGPNVEEALFLNNKISHRAYRRL